MINSADDARPASARAASRLEVKSNLSSLTWTLAWEVGRDGVRSMQARFDFAEQLQIVLFSLVSFHFGSFCYNIGKYSELFSWSDYKFHVHLTFNRRDSRAMTSRSADR